MTCPLDVIKTKLQAQSIAHGGQGYLGIRGVIDGPYVYLAHTCLDTVGNIITHQGLKGLYRGLGPTILGYLPTWAIYFSVYDETKKWLGDNEYGDPGGRDCVDCKRTVQPLSFLLDNHVGKRKAWSTHIIAAMTAGASGTIATSPLWVIKTRFMVSCSYCAQGKRLGTLV